MSKTSKQANVIQADARGRIQLPNHLRLFHLFEFEDQGDQVVLYPLQTQRIEKKSKLKGSQSVWLNQQVKLFLGQKLFPKLIPAIQNLKSVRISILILFGSRARGDALNTSDIDLALFSEAPPSFSNRHQIMESLEDSVKDELHELESHSVNGHLSFQFFSADLPHADLPSIYYSLATEGELIWETRALLWKTWCKKIQSIIKKKSVRSSGSPHQKIWKWKVR